MILLVFVNDGFYCEICYFMVWIKERQVEDCKFYVVIREVMGQFIVLIGDMIFEIYDISIVYEICEEMVS